MKSKNQISRRSTLKGIGSIGALAFLHSKAAYGKEVLTAPELTPHSSDIRNKIFQRVFQTPFIDTHEHLIEEKERLSGTLHPFQRFSVTTLQPICWRQVCLKRSRKNSCRLRLTL
jgi:hypothetical protein